MKQQLLSWWASLQQREQRLVGSAAVVVVVGMFYWLLWQPLHQAGDAQQQKLQAAQRQLSQLQQLLPQLSAAGPAVSRNESLPQIISNSARSNAISVSRMQPSNDQLTLVLDDVSFERLLGWLHALQYQHGVKLVSLDIATAEKPGIVRVRRMVVE
ncbi:type II secretion system protein GspM [Rheinheimera maricola]|uniref:Type II secretion system protein M n=1 Tax=Rheinheimera maricola TaxID=2793282 RepID=A0ABS7XBU5_9GAMM|nr:type II secretion system protein M [Rheinheimera maricola]MBZ9613021.1 type II secretion system protein M [Rheinheimera maricola]